MSGSENIRELIVNREKNRLLHATFLSPVQYSPEFDLSTDHPNFPPDHSVIARVLKALEMGETHYVDVPGVPLLRESIQEYLQKTGLTHLELDHIQVTAGMQEARFLTVQNMSEQYDSIALPVVVHPGVHKALGVRPLKIFPLIVDDDRKLPTIEGIRAAAEAGCSLIFLESPSRLTGAIYNNAEVDKISALMEELSLEVIWDQGLAPWVMNETYISLASISSTQERVTIIGELWPGSGLDRFFLGFIAGPKQYMDIFKTKKQILSICTNAQIQFAAIEAYSVYREKHAVQFSYLSGCREKAVKRLQDSGFDLLQGAVANLFAFRANPTIFEKLSEQGYRFADGKEFGAEGYIRLSVTPDEHTGKALETLIS
jgi:aspartate/methionine/tyrosine aminotransferase